MDRIKSIALVVLAVVGLAGCDPYEDENTSQPTIRYVEVIGDETIDTPAGEDPANIVVPVTAGPAPTLLIRFNKPMDGSTIEVSPNSCAPAAGLTFTPAGWAGDVCYYPSSQDPLDGGGILITPAAEDLAAGDYVISGTVTDNTGRPVTFNVTFRVTEAPPAA